VTGPSNRSSGRASSAVRHEGSCHLADERRQEFRTHEPCTPAMNALHQAGMRGGRGVVAVPGRIVRRQRSSLAQRSWSYSMRAMRPIASQRGRVVSGFGLNLRPERTRGEHVPARRMDVQAQESGLRRPLVPRGTCRTQLGTGRHHGPGFRAGHHSGSDRAATLCPGSSSLAPATACPRSRLTPGSRLP
jgi:hypothetical protein